MTEKSSILLGQREDHPREQGSGTSLASLYGGIPKWYL